MLTKVEVFSAQPGAPELSLGGFFPNLDPVQIREIDGIGPVKADIVSTPFATADGELYQGASVGKRNIVMKLGFNPNWIDQTISSLRQLLYRYLLPKAWIKLRFHSDDLPILEIEGYVESCDPNIFSQDPEMVVSIICHKPDFIDVDATIIYGVVDDGSNIEEIDYTGTVDTGFEVRVAGSVAVPAYTGLVRVQAWREPEVPSDLIVDPVTINGDQYYKMSSAKSARRVLAINWESGEAANLLMYMTDESVWPVLRPGTNLFTVASAPDGRGQEWTLAYYTRYGGL